MRNGPVCKKCQNVRAVEISKQSRIPSLTFNRPQGKDTDTFSDHPKGLKVLIQSK